ncbi:MAG: 5,6-dimethylbenzimidazole synthase [Pseudomonadota bacterium]|nr:5,6-dimethylbenzimidazole synthase [Pseudomonadota bacterium]
MNAFSEQEIAAVYRAIDERRDVRHFLSDPIAPALLARLLHAAHMAPSVGFMQPWRFIRIAAPDLRESLYRLVDAERKLTAQALNQREDEFMRLKVEGIRECGEVLVVALMDRCEEHVFGRRTLPEMDLASVACAIQNMWLAARAEGIGMGWVSMFDPLQVRAALGMPDGAKPIAILCLGAVDAFYPRPMLESAGWAQRQPIENVMFIDRWGGVAPSDTPP